MGAETGTIPALWAIGEIPRPENPKTLEVGPEGVA